MTCGDSSADLLPFLVNGTLTIDEQRRVEAHVASCAACRAEIALWEDVASAVSAEAATLPGASDRAWQRLAARHRSESRASRLQYLAELTAAQIGLVRHGLWLSSAVVMAIGFAVAWAVGRTGVVGALAPLVAAFGVSQLYGPQYDPALELTEATPTSPRLVLLARLVLVFGYDLALALVASVALPLVLPGTAIGTVIGSWLAPMAFLSALALVGSVSIGSHAAAAVAFGLWLLRGVMTGTELPMRGLAWMAAYQAWWTRSSWLFALAAILSLYGIYLAGRGERRLGSAA